MATLLAGPWIGEFGYELFKWQSYVRHIATGFDTVILAGRTGHDALYTDFMTRYINFDVPIGPCEGRLAARGTNMQSIFNTVFKGIKHHKFIDPMQAFKSGPQKFVPYGTDTPELVYDAVIHARAIKAAPHQMIAGHSEMKERRNWRADKWQHIAASLRDLRVCCIGVSDAALHIPGTDDMRDIPMGRLMDLLRSSKLIVGPSSGPMHLATLCGCPQVVWGKPQLIPRYTVDWNPFKTPVDFIETPDSDWDVDVDRVRTRVLSRLGC